MHALYHLEVYVIEEFQVALGDDLVPTVKREAQVVLGESVQHLH